MPSWQDDASRPGSAGTMPREAHRPYRCGMTLLCFGGLLNWLGLFENYAEPVRYIGVACVVSGAMLLCFAICCWLRPGTHRHAADITAEEGNTVHVITVARSPASMSQKPPDYDSVTDKPPSYEDAIKLSPSLLWLADEQRTQMERERADCIQRDQAAQRSPQNQEESRTQQTTETASTSSVETRVQVGTS